MEVTRDVATPSKKDLLKRLARAQLGLPEAEKPITRLSLNTAPLSYTQARLWFIDQFEPGNPAYNVPRALKLTGALDIAAMQAALTEIVRRHEVFRTTFDLVDGEPVQRIHESAQVPLAVVDLQSLDPQQREQETRRLIAEDASRPFDLSCDPLLRSSLLRLAPDEHVLQLTMHHIASDGWSTGLLLGDLTTLYSAFRAGKPSPLADPSIQYSDYAVWQRQWLQGDLYEKQLNYWKKQLAGAPNLLELPTDRPRPLFQSFRGEDTTTRYPASLSEDLNSFCLREGVTPFMALLSAYQTLLFRYSGIQDIVVGTPIANRGRPELEGIIGNLTNTLPLRADLSGDPTFRELVARTKEAALGAYAHQELPFEKLVEELSPERTLSHPPIVQATLTLQNAPKGQFQLEGLKISGLGDEWKAAKLDLVLVITESPHGLRLRLEYNTDLFDSDRMERLLGHYRALLECVVADPDQRVSQIPLLTQAERDELVVSFNATQTDYPRDRCVHELFEAQAARTPEAIAIQLGDRQLTYCELNSRSNQLARHLQMLGVGSDMLVGLCVHRSVEMVIGMLGILKAGGAYVPLDPSYPLDRLSFMLSDSQVPVLLTEESCLDKLPSYWAQVVCLDTDQEEISAQSDQNLAAVATPDNLIYVMYTSGSTGIPKGIEILHRGVVRLVCGTDYVSLGPERTMGQLANSSFDASTWEIWGALLHGAKLVILEREDILSAEALTRSLHDEGVRELFLTTALFNQMVDQEPSAFDNLEDLLFGGERVDVSRVCAILARRESTGRGPKRLLHVYGPTESTTYASWYEVPGADTSAATVPIGRPLANTQIYLLDAALQPVPVGVSGEVYVGGDGLARGYLKRPELTAEKFVPDPFSSTPGSRLYRTGDLCRHLSDGNIEFIGRIDHQVKLRGFRIELGEIESVLQEHPLVSEVVVLAREDTPGERRLVAYLSSEEEGSMSPAHLRDYLRGKLPDYMIPSAFVLVDSLPLNSNGKVDRKALPAPEAEVFSDEYVAPRNAVEEGLCQIWSELLHRDGLGVHSNFFELGGHSLLATRVVSRVRSTFGVELSISALFESPTVAGLADRISASLQKMSGSASSLAPPLVRVDRSGPLPLSFAQQRLWFLHQLDPESSSYNVPMALRLSGDLDRSALEGALGQIIRRHEVLRTVFVMEDGSPLQSIQEYSPFSLSVSDLTSLSEGDRDAAALGLVDEEAVSCFDLSSGPLLRARLVALGSSEHFLLLTLHHIVSDAWSLGVLMRELEHYYNGLRGGGSASLPDLGIQYADYASWQRGWLSGSSLESQLDYWRSHLLGAPSHLELPTDRARPAVQTFHGSRCRVLLPSSLTSGLRSLCQSEGVTLFMVLLAAFDVLLSRYSGQDDVVVGTPIANRTHSETEGLVGFFINTLALRGDLSGDPSYRDLLSRVKEAALGAYTHQDLPFEKLVEELQPERSLSHSPLFQVMLVLQNAPREGLDLHGLSVEPVSSKGVPAKFDLQLTATEGSAGLALSLVYNTDLFDSARMERMLVHFETLLSGIISSPDSRVSALPLLPEAERHRLLVDWNDTKADYPSGLCIHDLFTEQAARTPDATAVVFEDQSLTYSELNARSNQLAHYLKKQGVGPETLVGLCVDRSLEMVVGMLGILKSDGAYVPLDPSYPSDRLAYMLEDAQVPLLLTQKPLVASLPPSSARILCLDSDWDTVAQEDEGAIASSCNEHNLAYVIFTSGSTGRPKGVALTHKSAAMLLHWAQGIYSPAELAGVLCSTSICFDLSVFEIFLPLSSGGAAILAQNALELISLPARNQVTLINTVPSAISELQRVGAIPASVRTINLAGEPLFVDLVQRLYGTGVEKVYDLYGPSEDTTYSTWTLRQPDGPATIGRPIANTQIYILDKHMHPVPGGVPGELYIGGSGLARGYWRRASLTAEKFVPDPFSDVAGSRLYRTGDLCRYLSDGNIEFLGRIDHQVKVRGFRIELGEIESVLLSHPDVKDVVVIAREDNPGEKRLVGYVVSEDGEELSVESLREHIGSQLPDYMVPWAFVFLAALPLSPNGKTDRKALPAPDRTLLDRAGEYVPPRTVIEEGLAQIWRDVLRLDQVSVHDNFFELGGDSILSIQVVARARKAGFAVTPRQVFEHQTIAGLAGVAGTGPAIDAAQGIVSGDVPLTPIQHWFFESDLADPHHFNHARILELHPPVNPEMVEQVMRKLVAHHDALRLRFNRSEDGWRQINSAEEGTDFFSYIDLSAVPSEEQARAISTHASGMQGTLDIENGPVLRSAYLDLGPDKRPRLLFVIHHLAVDGVSWRILWEDLEAGLLQIRRGEDVALLPKTTSFQRWANLLVKHAQSESVRAERDYWLAEPRARVQRLPLDHPDGANTAESERVVRVNLEPDETRTLLQDVPTAYHTQINDVLLTALAQAFAEWTGQSELLVDFEGHGREALFHDVDLSRTIGWFTSMYPVLIPAYIEDGPGDAIKTVKERLRAIPSRGIGYGLLRYLSLDAQTKDKLAALPHAEVSFNYHGVFDQVVRESEVFDLASEGTGAWQSPRNTRRCLIDVIGQVTEDRLRVSWIYSDHLHQRSTIEHLANGFIQSLRALIAHCGSQDAGGYTPSDFPKAKVSQKALDTLLADILKR